MRYCPTQAMPFPPYNAILGCLATLSAPTPWLQHKWLVIQGECFHLHDMSRHSVNFPTGSAIIPGKEQPAGPTFTVQCFLCSLPPLSETLLEFRQVSLHLSATNHWWHSVTETPSPRPSLNPRHGEESLIAHWKSLISVVFYTRHFWSHTDLLPFLLLLQALLYPRLPGAYCSNSC